MNESGLEKKVLAFDFGASSGRAIIGTFDGNRIYIEEPMVWCAAQMPWTPASPSRCP